MNQFQTVTAIPNNFIMTNPIQNKNAGIMDGSCQSSFNYFQGGKGDKGNVYWGSEKPMNETGILDAAHSGKPIHSIWNNSTKRKTIVNA